MSIISDLRETIHYWTICFVSLVIREQYRNLRIYSGTQSDSLHFDSINESFQLFTENYRLHKHINIQYKYCSLKCNRLIVILCPLPTMERGFIVRHNLLCDCKQTTVNLTICDKILQLKSTLQLEYTKDCTVVKSWEQLS